MDTNIKKKIHDPSRVLKSPLGNKYGAKRRDTEKEKNCTFFYVLCLGPQRLLRFIVPWALENTRSFLTSYVECTFI